ncbi:MAG TPA: MlaD family protein [Chthoniobacterales bacterium]|jgi:ABC-type transporter Mla subunit MlaD
MQVIRSEIRTGVLVLLTIGALVALVLYIGAPGVFKKLNTYYVRIDNASGIKAGASVNLAGRKVGQIIDLKTPVPLKERPADKQNYEAIITIRVEADAPLYKICKVRMVAYGLLSELVIDFTNGDETSGLAMNGHVFIGERDPGLAELAPKVLEKLEPLLISGRETLTELKGAATNISSITADGSEFTLALSRFRALGDNLAGLTDPKGEFSTSLNDSMGSLKRSLSSVEKITSDLEGDDLKVTLANFRSASVQLNTVVKNANTAVGSLNNTVSQLGPELVATGRNASQFTDTIKRQPWRIIWPSTKKYDEQPNDVEVRQTLPQNRRRQRAGPN